MILLTHAYFLEEDEKEKLIMKPYVPLGILYLSAFLSEKGIDHEVYDSTFSSLEALKKHLLEKKPKIIGIYTNLMTKLAVIQLIRFIRTREELKNTFVVLGGPEIRYNAANYLAQGANVLVVGEGEQTFHELCEAVLKNETRFDQISGLAFLENSEIKFTPERALIKQLDELPVPARKKIDLRRYGQVWKTHHGYSMYSVSTMRGCPYTCKWCSRAVYGGTYRRRSPKLVADELEQLLADYAPDRIWFVDDVFTISHKWLREFHDEIRNRNLRLSYEIITRADRMNEEVISLLKNSGCFRVWIGAESGSQRIVDAMDRRVDVQKVREMIQKTQSAGMEAGTFIMLGYPGETRSDIKETIRHLKLSKPSVYTVTLTYPITGTPLHQEVESSITAAGNWDQRTDREHDFKRTRSKRYYHYGLRWLSNEVNYEKEKRPHQKIKYKFKSLFSQMIMFFA